MILSVKEAHTSKFHTMLISQEERLKLILLFKYLICFNGIKNKFHRMRGKGDNFFLFDKISEMMMMFGALVILFRLLKKCLKLFILNKVFNAIAIFEGFFLVFVFASFFIFSHLWKLIWIFATRILKKYFFNYILNADWFCSWFSVLSFRLTKLKILIFL